MPLTMCVQRPLLVGADCAGMGTDVVALKRLAAPFKHTFASETNKDCRKLLKRMAAPQRLFKRMCPEKAEAVDVYTCGFPCQPYRASAPLCARLTEVLRPVLRRRAGGGPSTGATVPSRSWRTLPKRAPGRLCLRTSWVSAANAARRRVERERLARSFSTSYVTSRHSTALRRGLMWSRSSNWTVAAWNVPSR